MNKLAVIAVVVLAAAAAPAAAGKHPAPSHGCQAHSSAYEVGGTLVSGSLTSSGHHRYSGSLTVQVNKANKHARGDEGTTKTYTLNNANVHLGHGENPAALTPGSRVKLNGKINELPPGCAQPPFTSAITIKHADVKPPKPQH